jgi:hypothetical protein
MNNTNKKFILYVLEHEVIENGYIMQATLNIQNAEHNEVYGIPNIPQNKITEKLGIPTRKVTYIMPECRTEVRVLRLPQIIHI